MPAKKRLNRQCMSPEKLKHLVACADRAAAKGTRRMLYQQLLFNAKQQQEKDYEKLEMWLNELDVESDCEYHTLYKEIANYILTDPNRWIYLSKDDQYTENNVNSLAWFLFKLRYAIVNSGDITCYWKECIEEFDGSVYLEPRLLFQFSLDLIEQNVVKSGNVIPLKYFVETLIKYNKELQEQEKSNENYFGK